MSSAIADSQTIEASSNDANPNVDVDVNVEILRGISLEAPRKRKQKCRFFATKKGCRAGEACPFIHDRASTEGPAASTASTSAMKSTAEVSQDQTVGQQPGNLMPKPQHDPRTFQINQIIRRFNAKEDTSNDGLTTLQFAMPPSDPDFPFDIAALECILKIPSGFPGSRQPTLRVTNKVMERGYQVNVERGFDAIWSQAANPTLLNAFKMLDKQLEVLLTAQKAEIVKLVANAGLAASSSASRSEPTDTNGSNPATVPSIPTILTPPEAIRPAISQERRTKARARREAEVQMLNHRLGRNPQYSKDASGTIFTVPIEPRKRDELPSTIRDVKAVQLLVPLDYDIEPCTVELLGVGGDAAQNVSISFTQRVKEVLDATILGHINYLAQNIHLMAKIAPNPEKQSVEPIAKSQKPIDVGNVEAKTEPEKTPGPQTRDTDRDHVKIIQRPPEWDMNSGEEDEGESTDEYNSELDISGTDEEEEHIEEQVEDQSNVSTSTPREKGILVSFPDLELHGIELLELILVNITVKCERCKDTSDITKIKPQLEQQSQTSTNSNNELHSSSCKKCATQFSVGYRKDIMHANSIRAGYLDLEGCTIVDLLPSTFLPTCADCSTPASANGGVVSVRGESSLAICRSCHKRMTFKIPEIKFLNIGPSSLNNLPLRSTRKPKKESLGIVAGTELPNRGRCTHYSKSFRWFRFSCCNAVYPCDRCHDKDTDHPNEFANRMICGWCSREQHYRPEDCIHCRKGVTGRTGSGFWEGGRGTRDRARMSRKDPRKYKRRGGGAIAARSK